MPIKANLSVYIDMERHRLKTKYCKEKLNHSKFTLLIWRFNDIETRYIKSLLWTLNLISLLTF